MERARGRGRRRRGKPLASPSPPAPTTQGVDGGQRRSRRRSPATGSLERPCLAPPLSNGWRAPWRPHRPMGRASACGTAVEWNALPTPKQEPLIPRTRLKLRRGGVQPWRPNLTRAESLHAEAPYQPPKASSGAGAHRRHRNRRASMPFPGIWIKLQRHIIIAGETDGSELSSSGVDARTGREPEEANVRS